MWFPVEVLPEVDFQCASADVLGVFSDGDMEVVFFDSVAKQWMFACDGSSVSLYSSGFADQIVLLFWRPLPGLPESIILGSGL
jgi:hypothetical protein